MTEKKDLYKASWNQKYSAGTSYGLKYILGKLFGCKTLLRTFIEETKNLDNLFGKNILIR